LNWSGSFFAHFSMGTSRLTFCTIKNFMVIPDR
jgi:hypothetical protein